MDNLSQDVEKTVVNVDETTISSSSSNTNDIDDIQFEEQIDIDAIQEEIQKEINENGRTSKLDSNINSNMDESEIQMQQEIESMLKSEIAKIEELKEESVTIKEGKENSITPIPVVEVDPNAKKYVIYIDSNNIEFMESITPSERRVIINDILTEKNTLLIKQAESKRTRRFLRHSLVATFTFIIGFPILFFCVNKATKATLDNFKDAKANFSRLYQQQGKVKQIKHSTTSDHKY